MADSPPGRRGAMPGAAFRRRGVGGFPTAVFQHVNQCVLGFLGIRGRPVGYDIHPMFAENTCGVVSEPRMEIIEVARGGGIGS